MKKKLKYLVLIFIFMFSLGMNKTFAVTDAECAATARDMEACLECDGYYWDGNSCVEDYCYSGWKSGNECGRLGRTCEIVDGECRISEYYKQFSCAATARDMEACLECNGYYWNGNSCVEDYCYSGWKSGKECGRIGYTCAIKDGECRISEYYKQLYSNDNKKGASSCLALNDEGSCTSSKKFSCVWNKTKFGDYCNTDNLIYIKCGDIYDIPYQVPELLSFAVNLLKIATPIILIIVSVISLLKALSASKEDEIKKAQQSLIKKLISAVLIFFIISIVQFVILKVADNTEKESFTKCMSCFLNNECVSNAYYKTNIGGTYICKSFNDGSITTCK